MKKSYHTFIILIAVLGAAVLVLSHLNYDILLLKRILGSIAAIIACIFGILFIMSLFQLFITHKENNKSSLFVHSYGFGVLSILSGMMLKLNFFGFLGMLAIGVPILITIAYVAISEVRNIVYKCKYGKQIYGEYLLEVYPYTVNIQLTQKGEFTQCIKFVETGESQIVKGEFYLRFKGRCFAVLWARGLMPIADENGSIYSVFTLAKNILIPSPNLLVNLCQKIPKLYLTQELAFHKITKEEIKSINES